MSEKVSSRWLWAAGAFIAAAALFLFVVPKGGKVFSAEKNKYKSGEVDIYNPVSGKVEKVSRIILNEEEWKKRLPPDRCYILRNKGTERPFGNEYEKNKQKGIYHCAACNTALFRSDAKFDSGTGWPSFWEPIAPENVVFEEDFSLGGKRVEVLCARCHGHLGHIFDDGPPPTGMRYCMNSGAMNFVPEKGAAVS